MDFNRKVMIFSVSVLGVSLAAFLMAYGAFGDNTDDDLRTIRQTNVKLIFFFLLCKILNLEENNFLVIMNADLLTHLCFFYRRLSSDMEQSFQIICMRKISIFKTSKTMIQDLLALKDR